MINLEKQNVLEAFLEGNKDRDAIHANATALNERWNGNHLSRSFNKFNREILLSTLDNNFVRFLESKKVRVIIRKNPDSDYVITYYRFQDHNFVTEDHGISLDVFTKNLTPEDLSILLLSINDLLNGGY